MLEDTVLAVLQGMTTDLDAILVSIDPALLHPRDALALLEAASAVEQRAAAIKTLVADRAADAGAWARDGYRSPEEWLSQTTGTSYGEAAATLEASAKLPELPAVEQAMRKGELPAPKLREIAPAATPENEQRLLDASKKQSHRPPLLERRRGLSSRKHARSGLRPEPLFERGRVPELATASRAKPPPPSAPASRRRSRPRPTGCSRRPTPRDAASRQAPTASTPSRT